MCGCVCVGVCACVRACVCVRVRVHVRACMHARMRANTHCRMCSDQDQIWLTRMQIHLEKIVG